MKNNFTKEPLSLVVIDNNTGHYHLATPTGRHVLTMIHPVQISEQEIPSEDIDRFKADLSLHQNALAVYECLETLNQSLHYLKQGKISIFDLPIDRMLQVSDNVLKRASEKD